MSRQYKGHAQQNVDSQSKQGQLNDPTKLQYSHRIDSCPRCTCSWRTSSARRPCTCPDTAGTSLWSSLARPSASPSWPPAPLSPRASSHRWNKETRRCNQLAGHVPASRASTATALAAQPERDRAVRWVLFTSSGGGENSRRSLARLPVSSFSRKEAPVSRETVGEGRARAVVVLSRDGRAADASDWWWDKVGEGFYWATRGRYYCFRFLLFRRGDDGEGWFDWIWLDRNRFGTEAD